MFECIMTQFEPMVKNSSVVNLDNIKIIRYNRTTLVSNGTFILHLENIPIQDICRKIFRYKKF